MSNASQPNRLLSESSLYLRQHAQNPVDWYPWGEEALQKARSEDKPIFLSIGYSACHWCHVMEHESFEDPTTAAYLNTHFVCIKVDREERPDLDTIYMSALQAMTREGGGWPLSIWLTPDLHPFYAGTYFPPDNRYAPHRPSFPAILAALVEAWRMRRAEIAERAGQVVEFLKQLGPEPDAKSEELTVENLKSICDALARGIDRTNGGFGRAPKFPHTFELRLLLRGYDRFREASYLDAVNLTLEKMALGGIYDQVGGGFHRYSVDARWLVPHFEKMLYDNALLVPTYLEALQVTGNDFYREVVQETLDYTLREMTSPQGGFYSTQDADSEGEEGKFYVWSLAEIENILGPDDARIFADVYDISPGGNFEGHNIPNRNRTWEQSAKLNGLPVAQLREKIHACRQKLYEVRSKRVWPGRDEKILTAWNGLMITAFAKAGAILGDLEYSAAAEKAANYLWSIRSSEGLLFRSCADNSPPKIDAYLEDYTFLAAGLVDLYQATQNTKYLASAQTLIEKMIDLFWDEKGKGFFYTRENKSDLITRTKEMHDGSTPAGNSVAVMVLLRLAHLLDRFDYQAKARATLSSYRTQIMESPSGSGQLLIAADYLLGPQKEIVLLGDKKDPQFESLGQLVQRRFEPRAEIRLRDNSEAESAILSKFVEGKSTEVGEMALFLCQNYACELPVNGVEAIRTRLESQT
ncbi:thioredoxin domain-containing protein [Telmatocola sphagniphila]|uniref:Thioredoxin domain-containing protein n=1 Tax=Telmatocola sphagniphila TaxID=1123043 RepID=A0A8E6EVR5_9BACT|nr:thioredoxin domain-containing protein [Telmatocola sphagniphila]QVL33115.1 thioredoxin domain-containing protein [Telmatocola sphagniphila]